MAANHLAAAARELLPDGGVPDDLVARLAQTPYVLIGEATHGTAEFSALRAAQTRRLIEEHDFEAGAIEGGWPDAGRVHRFVTDTGDDDTVDDALGDVVRLPRWMWRNTVVRDLVDWLREHNAQRPPRAPCRVLGARPRQPLHVDRGGGLLPRHGRSRRGRARP